MKNFDDVFAGIFGGVDRLISKDGVQMLVEVTDPSGKIKSLKLTDPTTISEVMTKAFSGNVDDIEDLFINEMDNSKDVADDMLHDTKAIGDFSKQRDYPYSQGSCEQNAFNDLQNKCDDQDSCEEEVTFNITPLVLGVAVIGGFLLWRKFRKY